jgi:hypothetical protein
MLNATVIESRTAGFLMKADLDCKKGDLRGEIKFERKYPLDLQILGVMFNQI